MEQLWELIFFSDTKFKKTSILIGWYNYNDRCYTNKPPIYGHVKCECIAHARSLIMSSKIDKHHKTVTWRLSLFFCVCIYMWKYKPIIMPDDVDLGQYSVDYYSSLRLLHRKQQYSIILSTWAMWNKKVRVVIPVTHFNINFLLLLLWVFSHVSSHSEWKYNIYWLFFCVLWLVEGAPNQD